MRESAPVYRFGPFCVDTREQPLTRNGSAISITPKVFDTLLTFLRNPGRLLTKDDLLQALWPDTAVEEANLTVNVSTLRRLLAVKGQPPCIETVPGEGTGSFCPSTSRLLPRQGQPLLVQTSRPP